MVNVLGKDSESRMVALKNASICILGLGALSASILYGIAAVRTGLFYFKLVDSFDATKDSQKTSLSLEGSNDSEGMNLDYDELEQRATQLKASLSINNSIQDLLALNQGCLHSNSRLVVKDGKLYGYSNEYRSNVPFEQFVDDGLIFDDPFSNPAFIFDVNEEGVKSLESPSGCEIAIDDFSSKVCDASSSFGFDSEKISKIGLNKPECMKEEQLRDVAVTEFRSRMNGDENNDVTINGDKDDLVLIKRPKELRGGDFSDIQFLEDDENKRLEQLWLDVKLEYDSDSHKMRYVVGGIYNDSISYDSLDELEDDLDRLHEEQKDRQLEKKKNALYLYERMQDYLSEIPGVYMLDRNIMHQSGLKIGIFHRSLNGMEILLLCEYDKCVKDRMFDDDAHDEFRNSIPLKITIDTSEQFYSNSFQLWLNQTLRPIFVKAVDYLERVEKK